MASTPAVADTPPAPTVPVVEVTSNDSTIGWLKTQITSLPPWAHTLVVLLVLAFIGYLVYAKQVAAPVVNISQAPPTVIQQVDPRLVADSTATKTHPVKTLFLDVIKHKTRKALKADGFNLIGKNSTPLTDQQIDTLFSHIDDETILTGIQDKKLVDGTILDKLTALIDWLVSHESQIMEIVKFLMSILALFGG